MDTIINLNAIQFTKQSMKLSMKLFTKRQCHYIEVTQGAICMEQNMRFWAHFGRLKVSRSQNMKQKIYEILTSPKIQMNGVILNNCID